MKTLWMSFLVALASIAPARAAAPIACNLGAFTSGQRARHDELAKSLWAAVQETRELPDGYGFRLPPTSLVTAAQWMALERRCCPFFTFGLSVESDGGPVWLRITGAEGVKDFMRAELPKPVAPGREAKR